MLKNHIYIENKRLSFREIFNEYYPSLHHFAYKILNNKHDAEDVVQDVFLNIWRNRPTFENEISFKAYIYLSIRNRSLDTLKKKRPVYKDIVQFEQIEQEVDSLIKEEAFRLLDAAIEKLPKRSKEVLRLSLKGYSVKEVSEELGISVNTVKTIKQRAYKFLKDNCAFLLILLRLLMANN